MKGLFLASVLSIFFVLSYQSYILKLQDGRVLCGKVVCPVGTVRCKIDDTKLNETTEILRDSSCFDKNNKLVDNFVRPLKKRKSDRLLNYDETLNDTNSKTVNADNQTKPEMNGTYIIELKWAEIAQKHHYLLGNVSSLTKQSLLKRNKKIDALSTLVQEKTKVPKRIIGNTDIAMNTLTDKLDLMVANATKQLKKQHKVNQLLDADMTKINELFAQC